MDLIEEWMIAFTAAIASTQLEINYELREMGPAIHKLISIELQRLQGKKWNEQSEVECIPAVAGHQLPHHQLLNSFHSFTINECLRCCRIELTKQ